jgi:short-subunit dehydrogenase involved in D-alanine esterification of teichoic acids
MQTLALLVSFALTGVGVFICVRQGLAVKRWRAEKRPVHTETNDMAALDALESQDISTELKESIRALDALAHHAGTAVEQTLHGLYVS